MTNSRLLIQLLTFLGAVCFGAENVGFSQTASGGWEASPKLVETLTKRRSETDYDEQRVPKYTLPDPLVTSDGRKLTDAKRWRAERRGEILELFRTHVYGRPPVGRPKNMTFKLFDVDRKALDGLATRKQVTVNFTGAEDDPEMDILIYLPNTGKKPIPVFVL